MRSEPEGGEDDEDWGLPLEMSPQLEGRKWSLFFRLARLRADYFSDIEDTLHVPDIDQLPTRDSSAFRRAIEAMLTQPDGLPSVAEQPTRLSQVIEHPTCPLPGVQMSPLRTRSAPTLLLGVAGASEECVVSRENGLLDGARRYARAWRSRLLAPTIFWRPRRSREELPTEQLSSSLQ